MFQKISSIQHALPRIFFVFVLILLIFTAAPQAMRSAIATDAFTPITLSMPGGWQYGYLNGAWGSGANDVYAVGYGYDGVGDQLPLMYHYDGSDWTSSTPSLPSGWQYGYLKGAWGSGSNNVYVVGHGVDGSANSLSLIYHYDGSSWSPSTPAIPSGWQQFGLLYDVWGSAANDVYAVGTGADVSWNTLPLMYHYDGSGLTTITPTVPSGWLSGELSGIWGTGASDIYAVGFGNDSGGNELPLLYHYDGSDWNATTPAMPGGWQQRGKLSDVWGSDANNIYAVGFGTDGSGTQSALMYHYDGSGWAPVTLSTPGGWQQSYLPDVWGSGANDVYAAGYGVDYNSNTLPLIYHYDGSDWTAITPAMPDGWQQDGNLFGAWGSGASDVYAVGYGKDGNGNASPLIYHGGTATHTVTFNANGGSGTMDPQASSVAANLNANTFSYDGYTFTGWNTLADGTGTAYADEAEYGFTEDITLYAQWAESGLILHWNFEEGSGTTTNDQTINNLDGTLRGGASWSTDVPAGIGSTHSVFVNGTATNDYVNSAASALFPSGSSPRTLCAWVKSADGIVDDNADHIVNYGHASTGRAFGFMIFTSALDHWQVYGHNQADLDAGVLANANTWRHHCVTYNGTTAKYYLDGALLASGARALNTTLNTPLIVGARPDLADDCYFDGWVDNVRLYSRELSIGEVSALSGLTSHTVTFNSNGGTGSMGAQTAYFPMALNLNDFTRTGYTFAGWGTNPSGPVVYADGASYDFSADLTLYAQWTAPSLTWYPVTSPTAGYLDDISITPGSNGLDGWAVGWGDVFIHWDGSSWNTVAGPAGDFSAVAMVSENDGWAANYIDFNEGKIYQWDGTAWSEATALIPYQESLAVVPESNGQDVWSAGWWGGIYRWDGSIWTSTNSTDYLMLYGVDALTASDAWAVGGMHGQAETTGILLHWNGTSWVNIASPDTGYWYYAIEMVSANDGWAVGGNGTIIHWDGTAWSQVSSPTTDELYGISMAPGSNGARGWAVGANGTMLTWNGSVWTKINSPTTKTLNAVEMVSETDGWAVGEDGTILRYTDLQVTINYPTGAPGSYFNITGAGYPANSQATISINNVVVGTVNIGADGSFSLTLATSPTSVDGIYRVTVNMTLMSPDQPRQNANINATTNSSASTQYQLSVSEPLRTQEGSLPVQSVSSDIRPLNFVYVPLVIR